jgi:DNA-binding transcriptional ArsR family regulator
LAILEREGAVRRVDEGGFHRFFPTVPRWTPRDVSLICLLRRKPVHAIVALLLERGPMNHGAIAVALGLPKASASYHLGALVEAGHVAPRTEGRERWYKFTDPAHVRRVLSAFEPVPEEPDAFADMLDDLLG